MAIWWLPLTVVIGVALGDADVDWLVQPAGFPASVVETCWDYPTPSGEPMCGLELSNGLISRRFTLTPDFGTIDYVLNATTPYGGAQSMFRAVKPEAIVSINGYVAGVRWWASFPPTVVRVYLFLSRAGPASSACCCACYLEFCVSQHVIQRWWARASSTVANRVPRLLQPE